MQSAVCAKLFELSDDVRHIVITDEDGIVLCIESRAKREWSRGRIKDLAGLIAKISTGIFDAVKEISGELESVLITFTKMKLLITKDKANRFYLVSMRRSIPSEQVERVIETIRSFA